MAANITERGPEVGIVAKDPQKLLRFYRDFLGFPVYRELEFPGFHLWWMQVGGGTIKIVEFLPTPTGETVPEVWGATGYRYVSIIVDNIDEIVAGVESAGGSVAYSRNVDMLSQAMLRDPEGNHLELVHWHQDPARQQ